MVGAAEAADEVGARRPAQPVCKRSAGQRAARLPIDARRAERDVADPIRLTAVQVEPEQRTGTRVDNGVAVPVGEVATVRRPGWEESAIRARSGGNERVMV